MGKIGTNSWTSDNSYKGLVFDLEYTASYMCWAAKDSSNDSAYSVKIIYHHKSSKERKGLHFACNTYADGFLWLANDVHVIDWANGGCGIIGKMTWADSSNTNSIIIDGKNKEFTILNDVNVDIYSDIDLHNWNIFNQSDARLKTNIQNCEIDALNLINSIELKEFDWIQSGEHEPIGIIAQQLQEIAPDLVHEDKNGYLSIKTMKFIFYLIKAVQELCDKSNIKSRKSLSWKDPYSLSEKKEICSKLCSIGNKGKEKIHKPILLSKNKK